MNKEGIMNQTTTTPQTIDEYIFLFPKSVQEKLQAIRMTIHKAALDATEKMSYQMPTFYYFKNLVHFAAYPKHIGFYPTPSGIAMFHDELSSYQTSKGGVRFLLDEPIPYDLIEKIVRFRVLENSQISQIKQMKKKNPFNILSKENDFQVDAVVIDGLIEEDTIATAQSLGISQV